MCYRSVAPVPKLLFLRPCITAKAHGGAWRSPGKGQPSKKTSYTGEFAPILRSSNITVAEDSSSDTLSWQKSFDTALLLTIIIIYLSLHFLICLLHSNPLSDYNAPGVVHKANERLHGVYKSTGTLLDIFSFKYAHLLFWSSIRRWLTPKLTPAQFSDFPAQTNLLKTVPTMSLSEHFYIAMLVASGIICVSTLGKSPKNEGEHY